MQFPGKSVIVTGAGKGIGWACAESWRSAVPR